VLSACLAIPIGLQHSLINQTRCHVNADSNFIVTGIPDIFRHSLIVFLRLSVLTVGLLLFGCSVVEPVRSPIEIPVSSEPAAEPPIEQPVVSIPKPSPAPVRNRIIILLSDDIPSYVAIAEQISQRGLQHSYMTVNLDRKISLDTRMLEEVVAFKPDRVIAIGLKAAKAGLSFNDVPMVFCQVFNFADNKLLSPTSNGVKLLPPFSLQFELWKALTPELKTVGLIIGAGQESLVAEIRSAAAEYNVELMTRIVESDKEALFTFKRLTPKIQGFLLLPDNRVLSPRVLREIIAYSRKHGTQTVVFNPQLLQLGADISFSSRDADIADTVLRVLNTPLERQPARPSRMTALTTLRAEFSTGVANNLSPSTVEKLSHYLDAE